LFYQALNNKFTKGGKRVYTEVLRKFRYKKETYYYIAINDEIGWMTLEEYGRKITENIKKNRYQSGPNSQVKYNRQAYINQLEERTRLKNQPGVDRLLCPVCQA
jgi:hypothetical protein